MLRRIIESFSALAHNKVIFLTFVLIGLISGVVIQLIWIHTYCAGHSIWGADVFPCRENTLRLYLGGPVGLVSITILYVGLFLLFTKVNSDVNPLKIGSRLALSFCNLGIIAFIPVFKYKGKDIVFLIALLFFILSIRLLLRKELAKLITFLIHLVYQKIQLSYEMQLQNKCLKIQFTGAFSENERDYINDQLLEDLLQQTGPIDKIELTLKGTQGFEKNFDFIIFYLKGIASVKNAKLEILADPIQKRILNKITTSSKATR